MPDEPLVKVTERLNKVLKGILVIDKEELINMMKRVGENRILQLMAHNK